jgi:S-disulfanyl-L-cysteine oxidoreductase SoxD
MGLFSVSSKPGAGMPARAILSVFAIPLLAAVAFGQSATEKTVRDGVYSEEQAKRGRTTYDDKCASCHDGGSMGPELSGESFLSQWDNKPVASFYTRVAETMPADNPGSLSESQILDIVAFVLRSNGFPAGDKAIDSASSLASIKFVAKK